MEPGAAEGRALGRSRVFCWGCPRAGGPSHKGSGPPLHPRGGCEKPAASAPALSWHHGRGRIRGSLPRPPSSQGPTSQAPQPPSASWGGQGLFLPCSPSPQLGCSWCIGVRISSPTVLFPPEARTAIPDGGVSLAGLCPVLLWTPSCLPPLSPRGHTHHTLNRAHPLACSSSTLSLRKWQLHSAAPQPETSVSL